MGLRNSITPPELDSQVSPKMICLRLSFLYGRLYRSIQATWACAKTFKPLGIVLRHDRVCGKRLNLVEMYNTVWCLYHCTACRPTSYTLRLSLFCMLVVAFDR